MKTNKPSNEFDIFTPIYEIFHEICMILFELIQIFLKYGLRKILKIPVPVKPLDRKTLNVKKTTEIEGSLGIDTKTKRPFFLRDIDTRRHTFIVGASGFGKTNLMSVLQEHSLSQGRPVIFFDPKGDMEALTTFQEICRKYQRPCYVFSEYHPDSIALNPLLDGTVNQVVDRIMRAFEWTTPYFKDYSRSSLNKVCQKLYLENKDFTLKAILEGLNVIKDKDNYGLYSKLEAIQTSDFAKILNSGRDGLTLSKIRRERACLYIGLSTQGYGETASAIGKLFLSELLINSYEALKSADKGERLGNPVSVHFDEFGSLVIPEFINLHNKCRGAGIELTLAVQSPSDIDSINPALTKQIIESSGNIFVLKQRLQEGASLFSEAFGTVLSTKQTYRVDNGQRQEAGSERSVHEMIVHPDIIKNLDIGQCVLLRQAPSRINLINIRERKTAKAPLKQLVPQRKMGAFEQ